MAQRANWFQNTKTTLRYWREKTRIGIANRIRRFEKQNVDYIVFPIGGSLPERAAPSRTFVERQLNLPPPPLSIETIQYNFDLVADAENVKGVVLILRALRVGLARLQSLRRMIKRLQTHGKRVIVYTPYLTLPNYYVATAGDMVVAPPSAEFSLLGLQLEATYYKNFLDHIGIKGDIIQISPYKSAGSGVSQAEMTRQEHEQLSWLLDDRFDMITADIAQDRDLMQEEIKVFINWAPFTAQHAQEHKLIDAAAYEDQLPYLIGERWPRENVAGDSTARAKAKLLTLRKADKHMLEIARRETEKYIGVISIEGPIVMSSTPPLLPFGEGRPSASEITTTKLLRRAEHDRDMAALIVYVNSPGGDALASDLMWRQMMRIERKKPVIVYMGNVAASGGYYLAAGASHIVANEGTTTGSIGVVAGRISFSGIYDKYSINHTHLKRGNNAGLYRNITPMNDGERALIWGRIYDSYLQFKEVVAEGREFELEELDPICEGRVWTGRQAHAHGLVDTFGDFSDAVQLAREYADLPLGDDVEVPVYNLRPKGGYVLPRPYRFGRNLDEPTLTDILPPPLQQIADMWQSNILPLFDGKPLFLLPFHFNQEW